MSQQRTGHEAGITGRVGAVAGGSGPDFPDLPEATVARLPEYLRALHHLAETGHDTVSSEGLAGAAGVNSAKLRKDLSHLGSYGTRGVGYDIEPLVSQIEYILGLNKRRAVALVGVGNLGHALAGYAGFASRGFRIAALFDADVTRVGELINGIAVRHVNDIPEVVATEGISIAVLATPAGAAQMVADQLVAAGVTSILNFAPVVLNLPDQVDVRKVDLAVELQILSFHEHRKSARNGGAEPRDGGDTGARDGGGEPGGPRLRNGAARRGAPAVARFLAPETGTGRTALGEVAA